MKYPVGTKVKVVSLQEDEYRGECDIQKGREGKIIDHDLGDCSSYQVFFEGESDDGRWWFNEENLELVEDDEQEGAMKVESHEYKHGDIVKFVKYSLPDNTWEIKFGLEVGDVAHVDGNSYNPNSIRLVTKTGQVCYVTSDQIIPTNLTDGNNTPSTSDVVNKPSHYTNSSIECIDAMKAALTPDEFKGFCKGNAFKPVKSDGGSSSYYFSELPKHIIAQIVQTGGIEIKDIVRYCFDNDADCKDIIKALKRIRECKKGGGKEGVSVMYDATKVKFFAEELYKEEKANVEK